ncbi:MAG: hypothetical protein IPK03_06495 [Bacteroidetes bacterium]|nr:hypothetical protein [Bacteroidota bacterium]
MNRFYWTGICNENRIIGISHIQECVHQYGYIVDFKLFSDISMSLIIEIQESKIEDMYRALNQIIQVSRPIENYINTSTDATILLNITFTKGTGNMVVEVPSVPG